MTYVSEKLSSKGQKKVLSCDGGGILGLMSVEILAKLETDLRHQLGRDESFVLADYFDFVCGTSTGALIAACISVGMSMNEIREFYVKSGAQMFERSFILNRLLYKYNEEPLAKMLQEVLNGKLLKAGEKGHALLGNENLRTLLMIVLRNESTDSPWPITNNPNAKYNRIDRDDCNLKLPLWQLVRGSTAAPTYFPPEQIEIGELKKYKFVFVDGGLTTYNNPAFLAFQMATAKPYEINWQTGEDKLLIVSVGTGSVANADLDVTPRQMDLLYFAKSVPGALMNAASAGWDMACRMLGQCRFGRHIDRDIGDMVTKEGESNWSGTKLFTYLRYDPDVSQTGLNDLGLSNIKSQHVKTLDSIEHIKNIQDVGIAFADKYVNVPKHFKDFI